MDPCPYVGCPNEATVLVEVTSLTAPPQTYQALLCTQHAADPSWQPDDPS